MNKNRIVALCWFAMVGLSAWAWRLIPDGARVPIHWDLHGRPNGWGGKAEALLLSPVMTLIILLVIKLAARFDPRKEHVEQSKKAIDSILMLMAAFMLFIHWALVWAATGHPVDISQVVLIGMGLLFAGLGNVMGKTRSNYFAGFRTPWTLASEKAWASSHRLGGKLFVFTGLGTALLAVAGLYLVSSLFFGVTLVVGLAWTIYDGYAVWKKDPDKLTTGVKR